MTASSGRRLSVLLIPQLLLWSASVFAQSETKRPKLRGEKPPRLHVLAVGIDRYGSKDLAPLRFAAADAKAIAQAFAKHGDDVFHNVGTRILIDEKAKLSDILDALKDMQREATDGDTAVIAFSGYEAKDDRGRFHLLPADGQIKETDKKGFKIVSTETSTDDRAKSLSLGRFKEELGKIRGRILILLDTCQSAAAVGPLQAIGPRVVVLAATEDGAFAFEHEKTGHGLFTLAVVEGLEGNADENRDGLVSVRELERYVASRVETLSDRLFEEATAPGGRHKKPGPIRSRPQRASPIAPW